MIVRLVKMTFREDCITGFSELFEERKQTIRAFPGCCQLELWRDTAHNNTFFTYSIWDSESALNHYRFSEFFKGTWNRTKALFAEKAEAWSVGVVTGT